MMCRGAQMTLLVRSPLAVSEPEVLSPVEIASDQEGGRVEFADVSREHRARLTIAPGENGLQFQLHVQSSHPVWLVEWRLGGWQCDEVIVPALGGQVLTAQMPVDTTLSYKYPFWWSAQFVIGRSARGGFCIRSEDANPDLKLLRVKRETGAFELTFGFEADAQQISNEIRAEWLVDGFEGDWRLAVDRHRSWMEKAFGLAPVTNHPHFPDWANDIKFVLEIWGVRKDKPQPLHTFPETIERLKQWAKLYDPKRTLVYLAGFAENGIDSHAPDYNPSSALGGDEKFKELIEAAHAMGYRVMIHTNVLAMTFTHRLYPKFKEHQVVDVFGRPQCWGLDMDGDWLAEPYFAYINPGAKEWGELMTGVLGGLIDRFKVDAVFLDQTLLAFNVSRGPNFLAGMRSHIQRLQKAFPLILFAGEGQHEQTLSALPMAQIHGIDSITEVHGMEGVTPWRRAHPVSTYLFGKYTRFTPHLLTKHPSHPLFKLQEAAYAELGVMPALVLYHSSQAMDTPEVRQMIARASFPSPERRG